jgi:CheY-like chemotaxis protein
MSKILIAEDEPDIRDLLLFTLQYGGHIAVATNDGIEAVGITRTEQPDLVILDVRMPRMTGYEACRQIKAGETTHDIPVVFLSAKGQDSEIQAGLEAGAVDYLLKPFDPAELIKQVNDFLKKYPRKP